MKNFDSTAGILMVSKAHTSIKGLIKLIRFKRRAMSLHTIQPNQLPITIFVNKAGLQFKEAPIKYL